MKLQDNYKLSYFTGTQASIHIGSQWISECYGISFSATQNIIPIFGYASSNFDAVARGKAIIQGSFEINFIDEGYMYYMLHKGNSEKTIDPFEDSRSYSKSDSLKSKELITGETQYKDNDKVSALLKELKSSENIQSDSDLTATGLDIVKELTTFNLNELDGFKSARDEERRAANKNSRNSARSIIYDMVPFDIQGVFGNPEWTKEVTEKKLINCFLISNEMLIAVDDEPLRERYSFIGQLHK